MAETTYVTLTAPAKKFFKGELEYEEGKFISRYGTTQAKVDEAIQKALEKLFPVVTMTVPPAPE